MMTNFTQSLLCFYYQKIVSFINDVLRPIDSIVFAASLMGMKVPGEDILQSSSDPFFQNFYGADQDGPCGDTKYHLFCTNFPSYFSQPHIQSFISTIKKKTGREA